MPLNKYDALLDYISYFEDESIKHYYWTESKRDEKGTIILGYPSYDETFNEFIHAVYDSNIIKQDYMEYLGNQEVEPKKFQDIIATADIDLLSAILTYLVREERFCTGAWAKSIDDKLFLKVLYRIKEILQKQQK